MQTDQGRLRDNRGISWTSPETRHLTLLFLGSVPAHLRAVLKAEAHHQFARCNPVVLTLAPAVIFSGPRRPSVLALGLWEADGAISALRHAGSRAACACGIPCDEKPFRPHITLARAKHRDTGRALMRMVEHLPPPSAAEVPVAEATLFSSVLAPSGAVHTVEAAFPFQGRQ